MYRATLFVYNTDKTFKHLSEQYIIKNADYNYISVNDTKMTKKGDGTVYITDGRTFGNTTRLLLVNQSSTLESIKSSFEFLHSSTG